MWYNHNISTRRKVILLLVLKNIKKNYLSGDNTVSALDNVSLAFRDNEFVSILGPSGSGKTTLLNIIGGLDQYTSGDLVINGKSTKKFKDGDWDAYRNHSVGFVFQSYNLIPHQSVLANVELALTLSGVSRKERRQRAKEALIKVGLGNQLSKKPNQMSGGQMQRVAIARALVNNPDILLADEPTGALDSVTSVQIMELLKEVSNDRLVIMVTHNPELADKYSSRIVKLKDGIVIDDTNPCDLIEEKENNNKTKKPSMSLFTALSLSLNNLLTKKARTFLTSFAGSIGIIGIALILSLSSGIKAYIDQVQEDTLTSYPIEIQSEQMDMSSMITSLMGSQEESKQHPKDKVYASSVMYDLANTVNNSTVITNDLSKLKKYFESGETEINRHVHAIQYLYDVPLNIYAKNVNGDYQKSDITEVFSSVAGSNAQQMSTTSAMGQMASSFVGYDTWAEFISGLNGEMVSDIITDQYDLIAGSWPTDKSHIILEIDNNNEITDITLHALGLVTTEKLIEDTIAAQNGKNVEQTTSSYAYEDILGMKFKLICSTDYYTDSDNDGVWEDIRDNKESMDVIIAKGLDLEISGIIRPKEDSGVQAGTASLYYTHDLTEYIIDYTNSSAIAKAQKAESNKNFDVFTGLPFALEETDVPTVSEQAKEMRDYFKSLTAAKKAEMFLTLLSAPDENTINETVEQYMAQFTDRAALEQMIFDQYSKLSGIDEESIRTFIAGYSDEELREMVETSIREMLIKQHKESAQNQIDTISKTPTVEELEPYKQQILANLPNRNAKIMYIVSEYSKTTDIPQEELMAHYTMLDDASINATVDRLVTSAATTLYSQYAGTAANTVTKLAKAFDEYYVTLSDEKLVEAYEECMPPKTSSSSLKENLNLLGVYDADSPSSINIYVSTFNDKDAVKEIIEDYNASASEDDQITYTDYVALIMSSVTTIIDAITYVLIAFVSISLVVSSIMIGIITYISVLERTKEIGILRAIGASKKDISRVFNAETFIIGFISGAIGIIFTVILCYPANAIIRALSGIPTLTAYLPLTGAIVLMAISIFFTLIAGLFPSRIAAKKDPVEALRTE